MFCCWMLGGFAQWNTASMLREGKSAIYFDDYVSAIENFNHIIRVKPYLSEPYFFRGLAKLNLDDFEGAVKDYSKAIDQPSYEEASRMAYELLDAFSRGEVGEIYLACTFFKNTAVHVPKLIRLLPVDEPAEERDFRQQTAPINYEPDEDQVLDALIPQYISGMIYGGLLEAAASENGARMTAMDSASNNAREMMGMLTLQYNQARQNAITQELTEIVAGANAVG